MRNEDRQKVKSITINGDKAEIVIELNIPDLLNHESIIDYDANRQIAREIVPLIVKEICEKHLKEITDKALLDVNWSEIVRSEVAQQVIKAIASKNSY